MAKLNLMVVDSDHNSRQVLEVSLRKAGFVVTPATTAESALDQLQASPPDLIVSETHLPEIDGFEFCKRVKSKPEWAKIPFLFLTSNDGLDDKFRGLGLGSDDYLIKPLFFQEIVRRIEALLRRHQLTDRGAHRPFIGTLAEMGVVDLIQLMEIGRRTCVIHFANNKGETGRLYLTDGHIVDAETDFRKGEAAVYRLLTWADGSFRVEFQRLDRVPTINKTSTTLIAEGMHRVDEWERLREPLPALATICVVDAQQLAHQGSEFVEPVRHLLALCDGKRSLLDVVNHSGDDDLDALAALTKLYFAGVIVQRSPATGSGNQPRAGQHAAGLGFRSKRADSQSDELRKWDEALDSAFEDAMGVTAVAPAPAMSEHAGVPNTGQQHADDEYPEISDVSEIGDVKEVMELDVGTELSADVEQTRLGYSSAAATPTAAGTNGPMGKRRRKRQPAPLPSNLTSDALFTTTSTPDRRGVHPGMLTAAPAYEPDMVSYQVDAQTNYAEAPILTADDVTDLVGHARLRSTRALAIVLAALTGIVGAYAAHLFLGDDTEMHRSTAVEKPVGVSRPAMNSIGQPRVAQTKSPQLSPEGRKPTAAIRAPVQKPGPGDVIPAAETSSSGTQAPLPKAQSVQHPTVVAQASDGPGKSTQAVSRAKSTGRSDVPIDVSAIIRARLLMAGGRSTDAVRLLKRLAKRSPNAWSALQQLAMIELSRGREAAALKLARRALAVEPKAPLAHLVIASVMQNKGRRREARAGYRQFLELCPDCTFAREVRLVLKQL